MATFGGIWKFLEFGNWESGNLESARNWLVLANFNILGIFSFQFRSLSLILNSEFQISNFSGIWKLEIWKSGNSRKLTSLGQFQYIGYFSHSVYVTELDFELRISNFPFFWIFFRKYSGNLEILRNLLFFTNFYVWGIISSWFQSWNWFCTQNIKSQNFLDFFSRNFLEIRKFSRVCYVRPILMYGASFLLDFSHWNWFCT